MSSEKESFKKAMEKKHEINWCKWMKEETFKEEIDKPGAVVLISIINI